MDKRREGSVTRRALQGIRLLRAQGGGWGQKTKGDQVQPLGGNKQPLGLQFQGWQVSWSDDTAPGDSASQPGLAVSR